jgi:hypothetical protein
MWDNWIANCLQIILVQFYRWKGSYTGGPNHRFRIQHQYHEISSSSVRFQGLKLKVEFSGFWYHVVISANVSENPASSNWCPEDANIINIQIGYHIPYSHNSIPFIPLNTILSRSNMRMVVCLQIPTIFWIRGRTTSLSYWMYIRSVMLGR